MGNSLLCLVGNKCDLEHQRLVSSRRGSRLADQMNARYFETSALTDEGIHQLFHYIADRLVQAEKTECMFDLQAAADLARRQQEKLAEAQGQGGRGGRCC